MRLGIGLHRVVAPRRETSFAVLALVAILALPVAGAAQPHGDDPGNFWSRLQGEVRTYGQLAFPVGEFGGHVGLGAGAGFSSTFFLHRERMVGLRVEGNMAVYGTRSFRPQPTTTVPLDVRARTTNSIMSAGIGPQIYLLTGAVRPYVFGTVGFTSFVTATRTRANATSPRWHDNEGPYASSLDIDDVGMAMNAGGGLSIRVRDGMALDIAAVYQHNGIAEYMTRGYRNPDHVDWNRWYRETLNDRRYDPERIGEPVVSEANLVSWRIGASFDLF